MSDLPGSDFDPAPNPYAAPSSAGEHVARPLSHVGSVLLQAFGILTGQWALFLALVLLIWAPYEFALASFEYDPTIDPFLFLFFSISTDAVVSAVVAIIVLRATFDAAEGNAFDGGHAWSAIVRLGIVLLITDILAGVIVMAGLVLVVLPGIYLMIRLMFTSAIVVGEERWGIEAIQRSLALTVGLFWPLLALMLFFIALALVPWLIYATLLTHSPGLDNWIFSGLFTTLVDAIAIYPTICIGLLYRRLKRNDLADNPLTISEF